MSKKEGLFLFNTPGKWYYAGMEAVINTEERALNAWPALNTLSYKGSIIRLSNGYTKRANSSNPLYMKKNDMDDVIRFSEKIYSSREQPALFKIIGIDKYGELDARLKSRNYEKVDTTLVMECPLMEREVTECFDFNGEEGFSRGWIESYFRLNSIQDKDKETITSMLSSIAVDVISATVLKDGKAIACGYGACEEDYVGFFDIVVDREFRRQGYGEKLMDGLMSQAAQQGIKKGYLQVVEANEGARRLYEKLGFEKRYSYWYRRK